MSEAQPKQRWYQKTWVKVTAGFTGGLLVGIISSSPAEVETASGPVEVVTERVTVAPEQAAEPAPEDDRLFANCDEAFEASVTAIPADDPLYDPKLDEDGDGIACERESEQPEPVEEPEPDDSNQAIGDSAQLGPELGDTTHTITVSKVQRTTEPHDVEFGQGPANDVFLIFTVEVEADASSSVYEDDFYVLTDNGQRIDPTDGNSLEAIDFNDSLGFVELDAGQNKQGLLAFDSPVRHGTLAYNPNFEGDPIATWEF